MSSQAKRSVAIIGAFAFVLLGVLSLGAINDDDSAPVPVAIGETQLIRADSHVRGEEADAEGVEVVTFVEFLDFECEGCRAAHPAVEQLRAEYAGRVTFVARSFPMPGHVNGERAARAVKAAAQQGAFEDMYPRMYETQTEWGEQQTPHDDLFRSFAEGLGLDMDGGRPTTTTPPPLSG